MRARWWVLALILVAAPCLAVPPDDDGVMPSAIAALAPLSLTRTALGTGSAVEPTSTITIAAATLATGNTLVVGIVWVSGVTAPTATWNGIAMQPFSTSPDLPIVENTNVASRILQLCNVTGATGNIVITFPGSPPIAAAAVATRYSGEILHPTDSNSDASLSNGASSVVNIGATALPALFVAYSCVFVDISTWASGSWQSPLTLGQRTGTDDGAFNVSIAEGFGSVTLGAFTDARYTWASPNVEWATTAGALQRP